MPITSPPNNRGFTLVEVMMAMLIMSVGLFGLLQSLNVAYEHNARNKLRQEAMQLAEEQMNDFRATPSFDDIPVNKFSMVKRPIVGVFRNFSVTWQSETMPAGVASVNSNSKRLTVAVSWRFKNTRSEHAIYTLKHR